MKRFKTFFYRCNIKQALISVFVIVVLKKYLGALIKNPPLLLFDEPTGALDYTTSKEILELIEKIKLEKNIYKDLFANGANVQNIIELPFF